ncbi:UDP-N-acetylenolpyruvoylglucosamine reductase [Candidatus Syntrophocurvum alkaliphilum]|uniref:UDP-N-acetylenolpyruvoylglucosamine reductase n=1 Tax=Candidatus Syntrophocurvum alkaliphilum TaxID=2293317 RepID=A0A6I6DGE1_9FIRM|nr:UDP-N-acetylmuramate dehydrogenase [Candidatus Syntrophocurvum alkaliphilum]QGT99413.1 UDP-N-acetylenolpyruvoylglucosamine reductase [Candidatus Syntrophocurvum alkaliphilum]
MYSKLKNLIPQERIKENEPMKKHTTFKIGGPADVMVLPENVDEIKTIIKYSNENKIPLFIFGFGSNLLVTDKGIRGIVLKIGNNLKKIDINETQIIAEAGIRLTELSKKVAANSLSGLEFAEGIPGSLGGAVVMNAGAYDSEMKNILVEVETIDLNGNTKKFTNKQMGLGYRKSVFQNSTDIIVKAQIKLNPGNKEEILTKMRTFSKQRREKQPIEWPSAGSVFKRPEGLYVGPMVEKMGLKGFTIGGAQVSEKHAGFIINSGNATANDVLALIEHIKKRAVTEYNVSLQPEIKIVGEK